MDQAIVATRPIILAHEQPFRIGMVEVRPATREFVREGSSHVVEPRVMQMLVALHRAEGGVVSKDDLIRQCWEGRVVGEDAINRVVSRLRHDAAEKAGGAFKIETITKVGYRLVDSDGRARVEPALAKEPIDRRRALAVGGAAIALAGGSAVAWQVLQRPQPSESDRLYDQGWAALLEGTVDQYGNAVAKFRLAADLAPGDAKPWGGLALAYQKQAQFAPSGQQQSLRERGAAAARRSLTIDPTNGDAIAASLLREPLFGNWIANERACRSALARAPRHPIVNIAMATLLAAVGRSRESLAFIDRAADAEPNAVTFQMFKANTLWHVGRLEEAEAVIERAYRLWPRHYAIWFTRLYILANNGRGPEALAMLADSANRPTAIPEWNFEATEKQVRAVVYPSPAAIEAATRASLDLASRGLGFAEGSIMFLARTGQVDAAYSVIDAYYFNKGFTPGEARFSKEQGIYSAGRERHTYFLFIPRTASIRRDPRFGSLVTRLGLEAYWTASGKRPDYRA